MCLYVKALSLSVEERKADFYVSDYLSGSSPVINTYSHIHIDTHVHVHVLSYNQVARQDFYGYLALSILESCPVPFYPLLVDSTLFCNATTYIIDSSVGGGALKMRIGGLGVHYSITIVSKELL